MNGSIEMSKLMAQVDSLIKKKIIIFLRVLSLTNSIPLLDLSAFVRFSIN